MIQSSRALLLFCVACTLIGVVAVDEQSPPLALYVPPAGLPPVAAPGPKTVPAASPSVVTPQRFPELQMPASPVAPAAQPYFMMPTTIGQPPMVTTQQSMPPALEGPVSPMAFLSGFAGGLAAGVALVYSLLRRTGEKVSAEAKQLELGARASAGAVIEKTALAPYLAAGDTLPAVLKQVASGRAPMPAFGRQLRAINIGQGRMVVVNMTATMDSAADESEFCYGLPGSISPFRNFDPAGFLKNKDKLAVYRLREAELTHGRVGMLASLGFIVQENSHPLFDGVGGPFTSQVQQLPVWIWAVMLVGIGAVEQKRIAVGWSRVDPETDNATLMSETATGDWNLKDREPQEGYYPGDVGFDPLKLKPKDPVELRKMQEREISNGRLAMIAAAGFLAQEAVTGQTWGAYWADVF